LLLINEYNNSGKYHGNLPKKIRQIVDGVKIDIPGEELISWGSGGGISLQESTSLPVSSIENLSVTDNHSLDVTSTDVQLGYGATSLPGKVTPTRTRSGGVRPIRVKPSSSVNLVNYQLVSEYCVSTFVLSFRNLFCH